jgi:putative peptidoglycan lipid II flippase
MSTNKSIAKSASIIGAATLCSRILGFIRDVVMARFFGTGIASQAFVVAFRIPNLFRDLVAEGAANAAFVPVFSDCLLKKEKNEFWYLVRNILGIIFALLVLITLLGVLFAPLITRLIAPGFVQQPDKLFLTIKLVRILFPYLLLVGLTAYGMGLLHTFKAFVTPALGPSMLNIAMILGIFISVRLLKDPVIGLSLGVLCGGVLQLLIQIPPIYRRGFRLKLKELRLDFSNPGTRQIGRLIAPRIFGSAIYQLNVFVDTMLASLSHIAGEGAVAAIYYANRIIQFPLAIFGIALSSAVLPTMSHQVAQDDLDSLKSTLSFSLKTIYLIMLPVSLGLVVLSRPIISLLFQRGEFTDYSTSITSWALLFYSLGLVAFGGVKILVSCFYSLKDTKTPVKISFICLMINVVLNIILMFPLKVGGLALASSISATLNFIILLSLLKKRIGKIIDKDMQIVFLKISLSSIIMVLITYLSWHNLSLGLRPLFSVSAVIFISIFIYIFSCFLLGVKEIRYLFKWLWIKKN